MAINRMSVARTQYVNAALLTDEEVETVRRVIEEEGRSLRHAARELNLHIEILTRRLRRRGCMIRQVVACTNRGLSAVLSTNRKAYQASIIERNEP